MTEPRCKLSGRLRRFTFPNMIITIEAMPAMSRPASKAKTKVRISRRR